jgi:hypothetical protein
MNTQLINLLKSSKQFQELPIDKQDMLLHLSIVFEQDDTNLFLDPHQLEASTDPPIPYPVWRQFLRLDAVKNYIKQEVAEHTEIAFRKGLQASSNKAQDGDMQAIKEVNDLKGVYEKQDQTRTVVLHYIPRPNTLTTTEGANPT